MEEWQPEWNQYLAKFDFPKESFQSISNQTDKYCVIIEPRRHSLLPAVIKNFTYLLQPKGWGLIVMHGTENEAYIKQALNGWKTPIFINLGISNFQGEEYNEFMGDTKVWKNLLKLGCKHALMFQTDTLLLKADIDQFLSYAYVGAPWNPALTRETGIRVGNGGLSLRHVETILFIADNHPNREISPGVVYPEDVYYCHYCLKYKFPIASIEEAGKFAIESLYSYADPCGLHKPYIAFFKCIIPKYLYSETN